MQTLCPAGAGAGAGRTVWERQQEVFWGQAGLGWQVTPAPRWLVGSGRLWVLGVWMPHRHESTLLKHTLA